MRLRVLAASKVFALRGQRVVLWGSLATRPLRKGCRALLRQALQSRGGPPRELPYCWVDPGEPRPPWWARPCGSAAPAALPADGALGVFRGRWKPWGRAAESSLPARLLARLLVHARFPSFAMGCSIQRLEIPSAPLWGPGQPGFQVFASYLVDSASSHMLVSKIKPCMSKCKQLYGQTANGSLYQLSFT